MPPIYKLKGRIFRAETEKEAGAGPGCLRLRLWSAEASYEECQKAYLHPDDVEALSHAKAWLDLELSRLAGAEVAWEGRPRRGCGRRG